MARNVDLTGTPISERISAAVGVPTDCNMLKVADATRITIDIPDKFVPRLIAALDNWKSRQFWGTEDNPINDLLQRVVAELAKK